MEEKSRRDIIDIKNGRDIIENKELLSDSGVML